MFSGDQQGLASTLFYYHYYFNIFLTNKYSTTTLIMCELLKMVHHHHGYNTASIPLTKILKYRYFLPLYSTPLTIYFDNILMILPQALSPLSLDILILASFQLNNSPNNANNQIIFLFTFFASVIDHLILDTLILPHHYSLHD